MPGLFCFLGNGLELLATEETEDVQTQGRKTGETVLNEYSKVTIEFSEQVQEGIFNVFARTSGTNGSNRLGQDLAYALDGVPRPLLVLAAAIREVMERSENKTHPLLKAALIYEARWRDYDVQLEQGAKATDLPWPDQDKNP